jgi:hypothetical protein
VAAGDVEQKITGPDPCELERAQGRGLATRVQLVPEQPAHRGVLVHRRAAALEPGIGLQLRE